MAKAPIIYVMGVSGCGKSTIGKLLAERLQISFHDGDDYHPKKNIEKMANGNPLNDEDRQSWLLALNVLARKNIEKGVVIACSALKSTYRDILKENIKTELFIVYLEGTFEEITERTLQRKNHFMPPSLLKSQFDILEPPKDAIKVSIQNSPNYIVDHVLNEIE